MERKHSTLSTGQSFEQLNVAGFFSKEIGESCIMIYTNDKLPTNRLSNLLFAWHPASWYGTELEQIQLKERQLIKLPALLAIDYLSAPKPIALITINWSEQLQVLMKLAVICREILLGGWFLPDWRNWGAEKRSWRAVFPEQELEKRAYYEQLLEEARSFGDHSVGGWISDAVEQLITRDSAVETAWNRIEQTMGASRLGYTMPDESEWLAAIGISRDKTPFRLALQLLEPTGGGKEWSLVPAVMDQAGGAWQSIYYETRVGEESANRWRLLFDAAHELPNEWQLLLTDKISKEIDRWAACLPQWQERFYSSQDEWKLTEEEAAYFLQEGGAELLQAGCSILLPAWWEEARKRRFRVKAKMKGSFGSAAEPVFGLSQIIQFDWRLAIGELQLSEQEFMQLAEEKRRFVQAGGNWIYLDPENAAQMKAWLKKIKQGSGLTFRDVLELHFRGEAGFLSEQDEVAERAEIEMNEQLQQWIAQLQHVSAIPAVAKPALLQGELREYQNQGVSWLLFLRRFGFGGILADDMGLGKTIQFIAYLAHLKQDGAACAPSLLICPTSVIGNWEKELQRFAPELNIMLHYGGKRLKAEEFEDEITQADLVITSYTTALLDQEDMMAITWNALCLDEAQNIKNSYTKSSSAIRQIPAKHRIALTGTPMENRLTELWSIYDFINPGYLGSLSEFQKTVVSPIERTRDEKLIEGLKRWVQPFMLRRLKKDPAIQLALPDKIETKAFVALTPEQGALYEHIVTDMMEKLHTLDPMQRRGMVLAALTKLKQLCGHPALYLKENKVYAWKAERSNKLVRMLELIEEIAAEGEKCLIFTQYVDMGRQIKKILEEQFNYSVPFLHGGVSKVKRDEMIEQFQGSGSSSFAFVLSLKAGGTGLNLTAANHVFHFDRWWNPAVENQATDRAFRIGQQKDVQVHKMITLGTLEEKIDAMIDSKQSLNDQVVGQSEQWITELSNEELHELFALRKTWING